MVLENLHVSKLLMIKEQLYDDLYVSISHYIYLQSICTVVRSTPTHCAGVHTVCGEGAEGYFIERVL